MKKILVACLVVVVLLALGRLLFQIGNRPEPFPQGSDSAAMLAPGSYSVAVDELTFIDKSRPTNTNGDYAGDTSRQFVSKIWHPSDNAEGPYPLVVYSHGIGSNLDSAEFLGEQLAGMGFVLIAANFPLTHSKAPGGPDIGDIVNQAADVSFLIDTLTRLSNTPGHPLERMVDETRIGVTGVSLGAMTSTLVGYHPAMLDPRIGAVLSIAGSTELFTAKFFNHAQIPFLMLAGDVDAIVSYEQNAVPVLAKVRDSQLITIHGGSHVGFAGSAGFMRWLDNPDSLGCYMLKRALADSTPAPGAEQAVYAQIGSKAQGINHNASAEYCTVDPLPKAINVLRQQMIISVVVSNFFKSIFSPEEGQRQAAQRYLSETLARELPDVSYQRAEQM